MIAILALVPAVNNCRAEFMLNFDMSVFGGNGAENENIGRVWLPDFTQEVVMIDGQSYYRVVMGDPNAGFALESYTPRGTANVTGWCGPENVLTTPECVGFGTHGGGLERKTIGNRGTAANDDWRYQANDPLGLTYANTTFSGANKWDISGTGTQDPRKVVFRQIVNDAGIDMEVYKPKLDRKPLIRQNLVDDSIRSQFVIDGRSISYDDKDTVAPLVNRVVMSDSELNALNPGAADFDMQKVQHMTPEAGRYTYTPGTGWSNPTLGWDTDNSEFIEGTYDYHGSGFDALNEEWGAYFDAAENCGQIKMWNSFTADYGC